MERTCKKCGETKSIEEFAKHKRKLLYDYMWTCKNCFKEYCANYYKLTKPHHQEYSKKYLELNRDKIRDYKDKWRKLNSLRLSLKAKKYYQDNKQLIKERSKKWNDENKEIKTETYKKYYIKNKDNIKSVAANYRQLNKKLIIDNQKKYHDRCTKELLDPYIIYRIVKLCGLSAKIVIKYPELIETYRSNLKLKRLIKNKNGNYENSNRFEKRLA